MIKLEFNKNKTQLFVGYIKDKFIVPHTLVIVRQVRRKGVNYNFSGGIAKAFCAMKELELAFRLDFLFLFDQAKRKLKDKSATKFQLTNLNTCV